MQPHRAPRDDLVISRAHFERPLVDAQSQRALASLQTLHKEPGRRVWLCGSYAHGGVPLLESAVRSAYEVAAALAAPQVALPRAAPAEALSFTRVADIST